MDPRKRIKTGPANIKQAAWNPPGAMTKAAKSPFDPPVKTVTTKIRYLQRTVGNQATQKILNLKTYKKTGQPPKFESCSGFDINRLRSHSQRAGSRLNGSRLAIQRVRWSEGEIPPMPPDEFRQWVISETETLAADHSPPVSQGIFRPTYGTFRHFRMLPGSPMRPSNRPATVSTSGPRMRLCACGRRRGPMASP